MRELHDSGYRYIDPIPKGWDVQKGKFIYDIATGKLDANAEDPDGLYPFFTCSNEPKRINTYAFDCEALLVAGNGQVGFTQYCNGKFNAYQRTYVLSNFRKVYPGFLKYYVSSLLSESVADITVGSVIEFIKLDYLKNFAIVIPPVSEQKQIAHYLDQKCANIDEAIERHRKIIEKLEEYKVSFSSHAVLHGITSNPKIKQSGVEWIGHIPESWEMKRGKFLFREVSHLSKNGEEELLTVSQYTGITPRSQKNVTMFQAESLVGYKICEIGDIAANTMWLWAGAIGVSGFHGVISPSYNVYRQICNAYDSDYLDLLLRAVPLVQHYKALSTGIRPSRLRLYPPQFLNVKFPVPPIKEQKEIMQYLTERLRQITESIKRQKEIISKLEEYRKSIIYNAVTGKIDCRTEV